MREEEILQLWRQGINKTKLAEIYKRRYNQQIRIIRASVRHRHEGRFITSYEALNRIEKILLKELKRK